MADSDAQGLDVKRIVGFVVLGVALILAFFAGTQSPDLIENTPFSHLGPSYTGKLVSLTSTQITIDVDGKQMPFDITSKTQITQRFSPEAPKPGVDVQIHYQETSGKKVAKLIRVLEKETAAASGSSPQASGSPAASGAPASAVPESAAPASASPAPSGSPAAP